MELRPLLWNCDFMAFVILSPHTVLVWEFVLFKTEPLTDNWPYIYYHNSTLSLTSLWSHTLTRILCLIETSLCFDSDMPWLIINKDFLFIIHNTVLCECNRSNPLFTSSSYLTGNYSSQLWNVTRNVDELQVTVT